MSASVPSRSSGNDSNSLEPLRILVAADVPPDPNAGASGTVFQMNAALRRIGHDVEEIWAPELGRRIRHGNLHYLLELPFAFRSVLRRRLKHRSYDVVEFHQPHAYLAASDFRRHSRTGIFVNRSHGHEVRAEEVLTPWRQKLGMPAQRGIRKLASRCLRVLLDRQWERVARSADAFHFSCQEDGEYLHHSYGVAPDRIAVITQGIPESFADNPVLPLSAARRKRLLYVGQLAFFKAPMILATAVSTILDKHPEMTMTWVCSESHHAEALNLLSPSIRPRVTFLDWMSQESLQAVLDEHGIFLFPSFFEGFGKAPLEAMSRGLCVIASNTGGMRDFIQDGVSGRLVPIGQTELMVEAAEHLIANPGDADAMSRAARESAVLHRWDRCAADLTACYRRWLARKNAHRNVPSMQIAEGIAD